MSINHFILCKVQKVLHNAMHMYIYANASHIRNFSSSFYGEVCHWIDTMNYPDAAKPTHVVFDAA